ncbi:tetratricopeptide repeat protein [Alicyclobacillus dauci]|uniref:Uncharacterized protein n=1 Tax=Alicyclobacillus dauci TaxID=1475485 RepID=A0ABY6Z288_9BACL|nr:hypothetical protein [Alicyclobacillus dauci]WAH36802.1 hypothetical protein NZD86_21955 [Alicyclobacillus dauci]
MPNGYGVSADFHTPPSLGGSQSPCVELGVKHIAYWCRQLEEVAQEAEASVVPAVIGLSITLVSVSNWTNRFPEEAGVQLKDAPTTCEASLRRIVQKMRNSLVVEPDRCRSVIQFTNWIAGKCAHMLDLDEWTPVLSVCILDGEHLRQFKERMLRENPKFLQSPELYQPAEYGKLSLRLYNEHGKYLVDWWCTLCPAHGEVAEAEASVEPPIPNRLPSVRSRTLRNLANYFVARQQYGKAVKYGELAIRLSYHPRGEDYEWLAEIYQSNGMALEAIKARESAFYAGPSWQRFEVCLKDASAEPIRREKVRQWTFTMREERRTGLLWTDVIHKPFRDCLSRTVEFHVRERESTVVLTMVVETPDQTKQ